MRGRAASARAHADPLTLAARKRVRQPVAMRGPIELHEFEQLINSRCDISRRHAEQLRRDPDIVGDAQMREQPAALEDVADAAPQRDRIGGLHVVALDRDGAPIRLDQAVGEPQQRRLARTRAADDGHKLAFGDVE
ncbi:hypothetical protein ACVWW5_002565 [Bradyrhizobium sp. LM3.4]